MYWEAHVEGGKPCDISLGRDEVLVLLSVALIETKKEETEEPIHLLISVGGGSEFLMSYLHPEKWPAHDLGLPIGQSFKISHSWKNGKVRLFGIKRINEENHALEQELEEKEEEEEEKRKKNKGKAKASRRSLRSIPEASGYNLRSKTEASGYNLRSKTEASRPSATPAIGSSRLPNIL